MVSITRDVIEVIIPRMEATCYFHDPVLQRKGDTAENRHIPVSHTIYNVSNSVYNQ